MKIKKELRIFLIILLFIILNLFLINLINSQDSSIPAGKLPFGITPEKIEKTNEIVENLTKDQQRREYLAKEWEKLLMKNPYVAAFDAFCKKNTLFFRIVFGMHYSLANFFVILLVIIFWFLIFFKLPLIIESLGMKKEPAWLVSLIATITIAQTPFLRSISEYLIAMIFFRENVWSRIILTIILLFIILLIYFFFDSLGKYFKKKKKQKEDEELELKKEEIKEVAKAIEKK
jgi:hypothetical protein